MLTKLCLSLLGLNEYKFKLDPIENGPIVSDLISEKEMKLVEAFDIELSTSFDYQMTVPSGFIYDGASIPRLFWTVIGSPFDPKYSVASLIHDYLYNNPNSRPFWANNRKMADKIFWVLLVRSGVNPITSSMLYLPVRIFGWKFYKT